MGRRFKLGSEEGDLCQACMEANACSSQESAPSSDQVKEYPRDLAGEVLLAMMPHQEAKEAMVEAGASGRVAQLLLNGTVFGKLLALEILRGLVLDQGLSDIVLDEAGLGPVAVALGVPPSQ